MASWVVVGLSLFLCRLQVLDLAMSTLEFCLLFYGLVSPVSSAKADGQLFLALACSILSFLFPIWLFPVLLALASQ